MNNRLSDFQAAKARVEAGDVSFDAIAALANADAARILAKAAEPSADVWKIRIGGYGTFEFTGTEDQAEDMRAHKARWEQGSGLKWRLMNPTEVDLIHAEMGALADAGQGWPPALMKRLRAAIARAEGRTP